MITVVDYCTICGGQLTWTHDHKPDNSGLDDGPPMRGERKKAAPKPVDETRAIRLQAWKTRREKYGPHGHR
jgi:hypothetical protein